MGTGIEIGMAMKMEMGIRIRIRMGMPMVMGIRIVNTNSYVVYISFHHSTKFATMSAGSARIADTL